MDAEQHEDAGQNDGCDASIDGNDDEAFEHLKKTRRLDFRSIVDHDWHDAHARVKIASEPAELECARDPSSDRRNDPQADFDVALPSLAPKPHRIEQLRQACLFDSR